MWASCASVQVERASGSKNLPSRSCVSILDLMLSAERRDLPAAPRTSPPSAVREQTQQPDLTSLRRITQATGDSVFGRTCQEESEPEDAAEGRPLVTALIYN